MALPDLCQLLCEVCHLLCEVCALLVQLLRRQALLQG